MTRACSAGRGSQATEDMKNRIAALQHDGADVLEALWQRHHRALLGDGYEYEYTDQQRRPQQI